MPATSNSKKKFVLLYVTTILIICATASAFILRPQTQIPATNKSISPPINNELVILNQLNQRWVKMNAEQNISAAAPADSNSMAFDKNKEQLLADKQLFKLTADSLLQSIPSENVNLLSLVNHYKQLAILPFQPQINVINSDAKDTEFEMKIKVKNDEIAQLKQRLKSNVSNTNKPISNKTKDEVKFLKWALISQSADVRKLRLENTLLKSKLK